MYGNKYITIKNFKSILIMNALYLFIIMMIGKGGQNDRMHRYMLSTHECIIIYICT